MEQEQPESSAVLRQQIATAQRRSESLRQVIESISSELALEPLLTRIVASAAELIDAQYGSIGLVEEQTGGALIRIAAIHNMPSQELGTEIPSGVGLAGRVLATRRPLWLDRYGDLEEPTLPALAEHAVIGVPIWWGEQMIGFFGIGAEPPRRFSAEDRDTLALLARHAAIAIKNARRYEGEQHRAIRLATINRIGQLIAGSLSLKQVFQTAVEAIHHDLDFSYVAAGLVDPDDPEWLILYAHTGDYTTSVPDDYRQSIHEGVIGAVARTRQHVLINNVAADQRYLPLLQGHAIRAELALPIVAGDEVLGVLNIESERPIVADDVEGVAIIADQLSSAIQNVNRYEQERRRTARLELIARITQRLTAHRDPEDIFSTTVAELHGRLDYDDVALWLLDPAAPDWLVLRAWASRWPHDRVVERQPLQHGLAGIAARQRTPAQRDLANGDERTAPELHAAVALPIVLGERLLGVLELASSKPFNSGDVTSMQIIADQLAVAVDQAQLLADTQRALGETHLLYETSRQIGLALQPGGSRSGVIAAYLEQIAACGPYDCAIALYEHGRGDTEAALLVHGRWNAAGLALYPEDVQTEPSALDSVPLLPALQVGQPLLIADVRSDERISATSQVRHVERQEIALALIPLLTHGDCVGLIILSAAQPHEWNAAELRLYQAAAGQLATALDNQRQQRLLYEHGRQLAVIEERRRLARELHDSVTQLMFSITLIAQSIAPAWQRDPALGQQRVERLLELSQQAHVEMRALLAELRPPEQPGVEPTVDEGPMLSSGALIRQAGLPAALRQHLQALVRDGLRIDFASEGYARQPLATEEALFRIAQEALHNVVKHAQAQQVMIRLTAHDKTIGLWINDDGVGFTADDTAQRDGTARDPGSGLGLRSMHERAAALAGTLRLHTTPGSGTTIEVSVPRHDEES